MKKIFLLILGFLSFTAVYAQQNGLTYYMKNSGQRVMSKDSADYSIEVSPPDAADNKLYVVREYGKDGKLRLLTGSNTNDAKLVYQGHYTGYFPDGKIRSLGTYYAGLFVGRQMVYYPNGKLYCVIIYHKNGDVASYNECRDSTGTVLTTNGNGTWKQFNDDFTDVIAEGGMVNGLQQGEWHFKKTVAQTITVTFRAGIEVPTNPLDSSKNFRQVDVVPIYPGGIEAFYKFIVKNLKYPKAAKENGTSGKVIVTFVVERDGQLAEVKVARGIGDGCDEEAVRVIKLTSPWKPGLQGGKPVRVAYSVPINF